ncbi:TraM recognition domain-containing protein [Nocardia sp. CDC159]|uniref:TraM recognition domain-containing protein n=1 Tax=Nocardia pulmonis TaxID=2951408 RepID=A0A9X2E5D9_9NOCA|nr:MULTISPECIES: TraM recognition domain-containing protein [Nocardia]MCM6774437.1 TraM recognition domain-containing protein [Nocardia pulmonis]MCM6787497.1 TraM recognition domain-containing protein [Nocardia sp. CDC159]
MAGRETRRRTTGGLGEEAWLLLIFLGVVGVLLVVWLALSLGSWWAGLPVTTHPAGALLQLVLGRHRWPWQSTVALALLAAPVVVGIATARRKRPHRDQIDTAARTMASPRSITLARRQDNSAEAQRLLKDAPPRIRALPGPLLGTTVLGGVNLYVPPEQGVFIAAGQRTGKTMAWAIPAVLGAWGPVLATSNKPDLYRHTVAGREGAHRRAWLCDPQAVDGRAECSFWVNLLDQVTSLPAARKLAAFFVSGSSGSASQQANARVDSYFDGGAQELLALYLFAAACAHGDLLHAAEWLSHDQDQTPALILRSHGRHRASARILEAQNLYARQRDGLYDMARRFLNVLSDEGYSRMVTPPARTRLTVYESGDEQIVIEAVAGPTEHNLPEFKPAEFVTSRDTLYALSMTGPDSAAPLTAALVGQILEAALAIARARPDGRLAVPLLAVLDEAANCARIGELPSYYTYCAGCGIILMTIIQVLEQGEDLWGANGLRIMRAQSIEIYGGNIAAVGYLEEWAKLIDDHEVADRSRSIGPGGSQKTVTWRAEPILTIAKLGALPKDRALIRLPGHQPLLIRKIHWWDNPDLAPIVTESLRRFATPAPARGPGSPPDNPRPAGGVEL